MYFQLSNFLFGKPNSSNFLIANNLRIPFSKNVENSADFLAAGTSLDTSWQYDSKILSFVSKEVDKDGSYKRESTRGSGSLKLNHEIIKLIFESMGTDLLLSHDDLPSSVEIQLKKIDKYERNDQIIISYGCSS